MAADDRPAAEGLTAADKAQAPAVLRHFYEQMALIRAFELRANEMYARAKIGGYCHLSLGEEATVVGIVGALGDDDYLFVSYRDHGYALALDLSPGRVMAELFGRRDGVSHGRGGSMHLFDPDVGFLGGYGIVGGQVPLATGAALGITYRHEPGPDAPAVICVLGDGATNIGSFHESLNLAGLWQLPIVYVIVNNELGMGTPVDRASAEPELYRRGASYRIPGARVDGDDPVAVHEAVAAALQRARTERKPSLIEAHTVRLRGHSVVDPARYRSEAETQRVRQLDPVPAFRAKLLADGVIDEATAVQIDDEAEKIATDAVEFADASPEPEISELFDFVYATPVANAPNRLPADPVVSQ